MGTENIYTGFTLTLWGRIESVAALSGSVYPHSIPAAPDFSTRGSSMSCLPCLPAVDHPLIEESSSTSINILSRRENVERSIDVYRRSIPRAPLKHFALEPPRCAQKVATGDPLPAATKGEVQAESTNTINRQRRSESLERAWDVFRRRFVNIIAD